MWSPDFPPRYHQRGNSYQSGFHFLFFFSSSLLFLFNFKKKKKKLMRTEHPVTWLLLITIFSAATAAERLLLRIEQENFNVYKYKMRRKRRSPWGGRRRRRRKREKGWCGTWVHLPLLSLSLGVRRDQENQCGGWSFHLGASAVSTFSPTTSQARNGWSYRAVSVTLTRRRSRSISLMPS